MDKNETVKRKNKKERKKHLEKFGLAYSFNFMRALI